MATLYACGFDLFTSTSDANLDGWALTGGGGGGTVAVDTANGRFGATNIAYTRGNSAGNNPIGWVRTIGTVSTQFYVGFAMNAVTINSATTIVELLDTGSVQLSLFLFIDGSLTLQRSNSTTLGTAPAGTVTYNGYHYYEIGGVIGSGTSGSVTVRRDMTTVISVSGVNTQATGNASWNQLVFGLGLSANQSTLQPFRYDDVYVCDNTGSYNNNFLGDVSVRALLPNAAGANSGFTQTGGSGGGNYTSVNEKPNDGDTSYVGTNIVNTEDTYKFSGLPVNTANVYSVLAKPIARKDDAGNRHITTRFRHTDNTEGIFSASDISLTSSYAQYVQVQDTNPRTGIQWTSTDLSGEFGPLVTV